MSKQIVFLLLSLSILGSVAASELCEKWAQQPKGSRCENKNYKTFCPEDHAATCEGNDGGPQSDAGGGGGGGDVAEGCTVPDAGYCEKWASSDDAACSESKAHMKKYCCSAITKKCKDGEGDKKSGSGGGGGGGGGGGRNKNNQKNNNKKNNNKNNDNKKKNDNKNNDNKKKNDQDKKNEDKKKKDKEDEESEEEEPSEESEEQLTAEENVKECCKANGVPRECMAICTTERPSGDELCTKDDHCESFFLVANYCGSNGQDNTECCVANGVPALCHPFCNGNGDFINVADVNALASHRPCLENNVYADPPRKCGKDHYEENGKKWSKLSSSTFKTDRQFPQLVQDIVQGLPACVAKRAG